MSLLRRMVRRLLGCIPDRAVCALAEEFQEKQSAYQKRTLKGHGTNFFLARGSIILSPNRVSFGDDCALSEFVHILGMGGVTVGNGVWVANHASIISATHPADVEFIGDHPLVQGGVQIEDNVWIGSHAVILPGVTLGRSCIVGAGCVVTRDVPPYAVVAGVPARILRYKNLPEEPGPSPISGVLSA